MLAKKIVVGGAFCILMLALALIFRPIPRVAYSNTGRTYGTIEWVSRFGESGIVLKLKGDDDLYYIQDSRYSRLKFAEIKSDLSGQQAEIHYLRRWSPIDPLSRRKRIAKVDINKTTWYSAFR
jgi:hypothetical protein